MTVRPFVALLVTLWLLLLAPLAQAQQAVPVLSDRVIDQAGWLQGPQHQALVEQLAALERELGTQMVVLIVPSTAPEDIAAYAQRVADSWKIGRRDVGDGLLLVVATQDRKLRIEVAKALEGAIPDLAARRIIDEVITPAFRRGEPAAGLAAAVTRVQALVKGEGLPVPASEAAAGGADDAIDWAALGIIALVGAPIIARVLTELAGRKLGPVLTAGGVGFIVWNFSASLALAIGAGLLGLIIAVVMGALGSAGVLRQIGRQGSRYGPAAGWGAGASMGHGGGFGGGSSGGGGGFSSGGGGDFGGGGASGGW